MAHDERIDPNTGRPFGDHGTTNDALAFALDIIDDEAEKVSFLEEWRVGAAYEEWPEFYEWLSGREESGHGA